MNKNDLSWFVEYVDKARKIYGNSWLEAVPKIHSALSEDQESQMFAAAIKMASTSKELSMALLSCFCDEVKFSLDGTHPQLSKWVKDSLSAISKGEEPNKVFAWKTGKGRKKGSTGLNYLQIACRFEILRRNKVSYEKAQEMCAKEFHTTERNVARIVKNMAIPKVEMSTLADLATNNYSHLFRP